ncbi:MAG: methyltransferase domain-containing protein [Cyanobacteria bacterium SBLK]|nr:methyltransferase domain-containing protein [Cyanobacteria bacterium SBLK]
MASQIRQWLFPAFEPQTQSLSSEALQLLTESRDRLIERDWKDAREGVYPIEILFDNNIEEFFKAYALIWQDYPQTWQRVISQTYKDFSPQIQKKEKDYPQYYFRNFHFQTDGYLSERSAEIYDLQVELLFNGAADVMRRRIIAPLKAGLHSDRGHLLDVACGTGRSLQFLQKTLPKMSLYGIDLSHPYLKKARERLGNKVHLKQGKGEALPYPDRFFTVVTSTFVFHEIPAPIRQQIFDECYRVLKPGGILILCDSLQAGDIPKLDPVLSNFATVFHEPYYLNYLQDNLSDRLQNSGFGKIETQIHWLSKYWIVRKS